MIRGLGPFKSGIEASFSITARRDSAWTWLYTPWLGVGQKPTVPVVTLKNRRRRNLPELLLVKFEWPDKAGGIG
jgi:hypothetical protein